MRRTKLIFKILIVLILLVIFSLVFYKIEKKYFSPYFNLRTDTDNNISISSDCLFEVREVKTQLVNYGQTNVYYEIKGFLKSEQKDYLNSIISKIYLDEDKQILFAEGSLEINRWVEKNEGIPFIIKALIKVDDQISKEVFEKKISLIFDTYPISTLCKMK